MARQPLFVREEVTLVRRRDREWRFATDCAPLGRKRKWLALLTKLIKVPYEVTVPDLRNTPYWDSLRDHPEFKARLADPKNSAPF